MEGVVATVILLKLDFEEEGNNEYIQIDHLISVASPCCVVLT